MWMFGEVFTIREGGESFCGCETKPSVCRSLLIPAVLTFTSSCVGGWVVMRPWCSGGQVTLDGSEAVWRFLPRLGFAPPFSFFGETIQPWVMACSARFLHTEPPVCGDHVWILSNVCTNMIIFLFGPSIVSGSSTSEHYAFTPPSGRAKLSSTHQIDDVRCSLNKTRSSVLREWSVRDG